MKNNVAESGKEPLLISACLLGKKVRYDGEAKPLPGHILEKLEKKFNLIPACPERLGGLPCPRAPAEIQGNKVVTRNGLDVTLNYHAGARESLFLCGKNHVKIALLKNKSPSCGCGSIYSGRFDGKLIEGDGITAALLKKNGIQVFSEDKAEQVLKTCCENRKEFN